VEIIFHSDFRFSIYSKSTTLLVSEICLLSQKGSSSFFESFLIGQTNHTKSGPANGHLPASSKYIVKLCLFIRVKIAFTYPFASENLSTKTWSENNFYNNNYR
jgi:hypothetical protein